MALLLSDTFDYSNGVVTNEFATYNPGKPKIHVSSTWIATSGTLFAQDGQGYSGRPDGGPADIDSTKGNGSAVYRVITRRRNFAEVYAQFDLTNRGLVTTPRTPAHDYDGVHVFLRRQDEDNTYYVTVNRRDNTVVIKKKLGGNYIVLNTPVARKVPFGGVQKRVQASVRTEADGSVRLRLFVNHQLIQEAVDPANQGPIRAPGTVGIRGDNCEFLFDNFEVHSLA
jgi:hypothetical protein